MWLETEDIAASILDFPTTRVIDVRNNDEDLAQFREELEALERAFESFQWTATISPEASEYFHNLALAPSDQELNQGDTKAIDDYLKSYAPKHNNNQGTHH